MTVEQFLNQNFIKAFRIVVYLNWKAETVYDSTKTKYDMPNLLYDSIVQNVYTDSDIVEIEI